MQGLVVITTSFLLVMISANEADYEVEIDNDRTHTMYELEKFAVDFDSLKKVVTELERKPRGMHAGPNEYADEIFKNIRKLMIHHSFDPFQLPDKEPGFNFTFLFIRYHGELKLTKGWLTDLSTIHREGNVTMEYIPDQKYLQVTVPIAFDDMIFTYDYSAKLMNLGPTGGIEGRVSNLKVEVKIGFDCEHFVASLDEFYILNSGAITFEFVGHFLVDWMLNLLTGVTLTVLKEVILLVAETFVRGALNNIITGINGLIGGVHDPSTVTSTVSEIMGNNIL